jgi:hypothetical protein
MARVAGSYRGCDASAACAGPSLVRQAGWAGNERVGSLGHGNLTSLGRGGNGLLSRSRGYSVHSCLNRPAGGKATRPWPGSLWAELGSMSCLTHLARTPSRWRRSRSAPRRLHSLKVREIKRAGIATAAVVACGRSFPVRVAVPLPRELATRPALLTIDYEEI